MIYCFVSVMQRDITYTRLRDEASLCHRLRFHVNVSNISLLSKPAEDARKSARL